MSKSSKRSNRRTCRGTTDRSATTDIVSQLECAFRNPRAAALGAVIGGLVPWFGRTLAHGEVPDAWASGRHGIALAIIAVVLGCALFSGLSVYKFGKAAFGDERKALGFVIALEGVMLVSHGTTSAVALITLIGINAVANGSVIALARDATRRRNEADARRAASRARARGAAHGATNTPVSERSIPVVEGTIAAAPRAQHAYPGHAPRPTAPPPVRWAPRPHTDVIDAVIVSERRLLA